MNEKKIDDKELSTSRLAKELKTSTQDMFQKLVSFGLITRANDNWELTPFGKKLGGLYKDTEKFGRYIVWPGSIIQELEETNQVDGKKFITATTIGKEFDVSPNRVNSILWELGWIEKNVTKGWLITPLGENRGGMQSRYKETGIPFVRWIDTILNNKLLITSINESKGEVSNEIENKPGGSNQEDFEFRNKFPANLRASDGHLVRSKSEVIIDNWLYVYKITHAYEKKVHQIEEPVYCDFFINSGKGVYIEYWGFDNDPKYNKRKEKKLEAYKKNNLRLIELVEKDVNNIDDILPGKLRSFDIPIPTE